MASFSYSLLSLIKTRMYKNTDVLFLWESKCDRDKKLFFFSKLLKVIWIICDTLLFLSHLYHINVFFVYM